MFKKRPIVKVMLIVFFVVIAVITVWVGNVNAEQSVWVLTATVANNSEPLYYNYKISGRFIYTNTLSQYSEDNILIEEVLINLGDNIKKGDIIAKGISLEDETKIEITADRTGTVAYLNMTAELSVSTGEKIIETTTDYSKLSIEWYADSSMVINESSDISYSLNNKDGTLAFVNRVDVGIIKDTGNSKTGLTYVEDAGDTSIAHILSSAPVLSLSSNSLAIGQVVPLNSIKIENGREGVYVVEVDKGTTGETRYLRFIPATVVETDGYSAIIEPTSLVLSQEVVVAHVQPIYDGVHIKW